MKRLISLLLCAIILFSCCVFQSGAVDEDNFVPYVIEFSLTSPVYENETAESRVSGLILSYGLYLSVSGTTLEIQGQTNCVSNVVKCGFKNFVIQRKKVTSATWSDYYDYGDLCDETFSAVLSTTLAVTSGYQYRISCKHYAKKNLLMTQSISNTSNVVSV